MTVRGFTLNDGQTAVTSSTTGTIPSGVAAGDLLVLCSCENTSTKTHSLSGGGTGLTWTVRSGPDDNSTNLRSYVWTATAVADSAGSTVTLTSTGSGSGRLIGAGAAITGPIESGVLVALTSQTTAGTSMPFPSVTVPDSRGWTLLGLALMRVGTTTAPTLTAPTGTTKQAEAKTAISLQPEYTASLVTQDTTAGSGSHSPGTGSASASATDSTLYTVGFAPSASGTGVVTVGGSGTAQGSSSAAGQVSIGGTAAYSTVSVAASPGVVSLGGSGTARAAATAVGSVSVGGLGTANQAPAVLVDLYDYYLDQQGNLDRWMRGAQITPPTLDAPGAPLNAQANLVSGTATVTWSPPSSDGGSPATAVTVTLEGGATHTLAASATSDTFTGLGAGPYSFDISYSNLIGTGPIAVASTKATAYRFPGDPMPLLTGNILWGCTEHDRDGTVLDPTHEFAAPEADTGKKYSITKIFYTGGSVESCFVPSTGGIAQDMKAHWAKGHILLANVAIQASSSTHFSTWRAAANTADSVVYNTYYNFIQWCEEGADAPSCPVWVCMPHEPQGGGKVSLTTSAGMTPGDYGDLQLAFRKCMNDYATAKAGSPSAYKWKRLAYLGIHTGEAFTIGTGSPSYASKHIDFYYTSQAGGGTSFAPSSVHDIIGADAYQVPIDPNVTALGRTGVPMWNAAAQAMVAWTKAKGVPAIFGEYGIRQTDGDAGDQLLAFFNEITNGTHDVVAALYFNSPGVNQGGLVSTGATWWLLTDHWNNDPTQPINSLGVRDSAGRLMGELSTFESLMRKSNVVRFWQLGSPGIPGGYSKPPGV